MLRIRVNIFPPGGCRFTETDGTNMVGKSWREVTARVTAYRKRNGLPLGDPAREIHAQHCQVNPNNCFSVDGADAQTIAALKVATLKSRVLKWFSGVRKASKEFVSAELAQQRSNTCAGCPQAQSLPQGCSSCLAAVKELRSEVIGSRVADARLVHRGCNILGADLATAVWLDVVTVENHDLPALCWRKRST